jgi:FKBP-type peptidyl-prolyl cis-trans isomerase SlyD
MKIEAGCLVGLNVRMFDAQGNLLEATEAPIVYLHGAGDIFARIESALENQEVGFTASLLLEPEEAFGDFDADQVHLVDVDALGGDIVSGMRFEGLPGHPDGRTYLVTDVAEGMAVLDGNHTLAGLTLRFDVEVVSVQPASSEELAAANAPAVPDFLRVVAPYDLHDGDESGVTNPAPSASIRKATARRRAAKAYRARPPAGVRAMNHARSLQA